ncbi:MAG: hypothetical protein HY548_01765 [Elusimicrobia bacterium]|nr:hypothetical protein [Elusimicrobiota bacterium]
MELLYSMAPRIGNVDETFLVHGDAHGRLESIAVRSPGLKKPVMAGGSLNRPYGRQDEQDQDQPAHEAPLGGRWKPPAALIS